MELLTSIEEVRQALVPARRESKSVGFVATMGALHAGHVALVRAARARTDVVAVSVFVNPTQFSPGEDFERYPRDLAGDRELLEAEGVDLLFAPSVEEMYRGGGDVRVEPGPIGDVLEGASRPGHFAGVATVVAKLLGIVSPDCAFFGEKDYQQLLVVRRLVEALHIPSRVVGVPTVREADGLAMSSRNRYLSAGERGAALALRRALAAAQDAYAAGERDGNALVARMEQVLGSEPLVEPDYAAVTDASTLEPLREVGVPARALVAARVGSARLIDNAPLPADPSRR